MDDLKLTKIQAIELMEEYIEKWPHSMGEKHMRRWIEHLQEMNAKAAQKAFDILIMKHDRPFAFENLVNLSQNYIPRKSVLQEIEEWKKQARFQEQAKN